ncbi:16S rRNA (cytosine(1402)-N(4))-methyltransferase RsmH [Candidatus Sumerlaeota bacterium]|nr:16S rRNA (cytosine(1402)-N(4))-methyltransferase RsmH [Candidatus Sumerlaeota bacterium]
MPEEVVAALSPRPGGVYVDATAGLLGHTRLLLAAAEDCRVIAIERDPRVLAEAQRFLQDDAALAARIELIQGSYAELEMILDRAGVERIDGVIFDLGANSLQFDRGEYGFSFQQDGPLSMLFDPQSGETSAEEFVNRADERTLADVIYRYGEERASRKVARAIVEARRRRPLRTTFDLAQVVRSVVRKSQRDRQDECVRTFQALRIYCNREFEHLKQGLPAAINRLAAGGTAATLSFHSGEDRICKQIMRQAAGKLTEIHEAPVPEVEFKGEFELVWKKPQLPTPAEMSLNPRSRSAKLRAIRRVSG